MMYKVIVDYGKPFEKEFETEKEVLNYLEELDILDKEECAYFEIMILKEDKDITEEVFNKYYECAYSPITEIIKEGVI